MKVTFKSVILWVLTVLCCQIVYGQQNRSLLADIERFRRSTVNLRGDDNAKAQSLENVHQSMLSTQMTDYSLDDLRNNGREAIAKLFQGRIDLRNQLISWERQKPNGTVNERLANAVRRLFSTFRTTEDMIGEIQINHRTLARGEQALRAFTPTANANMVVFNNQPLRIQSGDVIITRGNRYDSAAISKITVEDTNFSHVLIVYADPNSGKLYAVESQVETGIVIRDLDEILTEGVGRMILMRYPDAQVAHRAASIVYERAWRTNGQEPYDFTMTLYKTLPNGQVVPNYDSFFCSKLIRYAFDLATNGQFVPGRYLSRLPYASNSDLLRRVGVQATQTISPGDLEIETRFQLIAEWRDFRITQELRVKEAIIDKLYDLMENYGYEFRNSTRVSMIAATAKRISQNPILNSMVAVFAQRIPSTVSQELMETMIMLQLTTEPIFRDLTNADRHLSRTTGYSMSPSGMAAYLNQAFQQNRYSLEFLRQRQ